MSPRTLESMTKVESGRNSGSVTQAEGFHQRTEERLSLILERRIRARYVVAMVLVILAVSNVHFILANQGLERERANALGMLLIAAEGALSESTHILNSTVESHCIDFALWDDLQQDLIWQSRILSAIASLGTRHRSFWVQIQDSLVSLERVVSNVKQLYARIFVHLLNLTDKQTTQIALVRDLLIVIRTSAFPAYVVLGANPEVVISDESMMRAAEAANRLDSEANEFQECLSPTHILAGG